LNNKKKTGLALVGLALVVVGGGVALSFWTAHGQNGDAPASLVVKKKRQLEALDKLDGGLLAPKEAAYNPQVRTPDLRDSGREGVALFIRHTFFRIAGDIGFDVGYLSAMLVPTSKGAPGILDDPTSFVFKPLHGDALMPASALTALFNDYLIDYPGTQLRDIRIQAHDDGTLQVNGQTQKVPGLWLDFEMRGPVRLVDHHLFVYEPDKIDIAKLPAKGLLDLIRLRLSSFVQIETEGAELSGDAIVLDLNHSLPPPTQDVHVASMSLDGAGLHLNFTSDYDPSWPEPILDRDSYITLAGGDLKTFRSLITHVRMQLVPAEPGKLDTSLYAYRQQITGGHFEATRAGELIAFLAPLAAPAAGTPPTPSDSGDRDDAR
tara:strand:+ start:11909 stop:13039 length:1131 start_codon:yes stop_codon:yes gene_type:complete